MADTAFAIRCLYFGDQDSGKNLLNRYWIAQFLRDIEDNDPVGYAQFAFEQTMEFAGGEHDD